MIRTITLTILLSTCCSGVWAGDLPDPVTTPGALNPQVTQATIDKTVCLSGWTKTIRPPASYTNALKAKQMAAMGLTGKPSDFEEDHVVSLELGGDPRSPMNLWPQKWDGQWGAHRKDVIETKLKRLVCDHTITLNEAQQAISTNWIAAYQKYIGPTP